MLYIPEPPQIKRNAISRRQLLQLSGLSAAAFLLNGCGSSFLSREVNQISEPLNQSIEALILNPRQPVPEFSPNAIQPEALLVNTFDQTPQINPQTFRLTIDGEVAKPMEFSMEEIQRLPLTSMIIRHVCVEGWAAIVQWGGIRIRDLALLVQPKPSARYAYFESADGYYESWDLDSALHPQTLLAYQKNGQPLPVENGAPLRLAAPIKLGYKQSKWVTKLTFTSQLPTEKGYWVDRGYEWFAGL